MPHCSSEHDEQFESMVGGAELVRSWTAPAAMESDMSYSNSLAEGGRNISEPITNSELSRIVRDKEFIRVIELIKKTSQVEPREFILGRYIKFINDPAAIAKASEELSEEHYYIRDPKERFNNKYVLISKSELTGGVKIMLGTNEIKTLIDELNKNVESLYPKNQYNENYSIMVVEGAIHDNFNDAINDSNPPSNLGVNTLVNYNIDILAGAIINYITKQIMANSVLVAGLAIEIISIYTRQTSILGRLIGLTFLINYLKIKGVKGIKLLNFLQDKVIKMIKATISTSKATRDVLSVQFEQIVLNATNAINKKAEDASDQAQEYRRQYADGIDEMFEKLNVDPDMKQAAKEIVNLIRPAREEPTPGAAAEEEPTPGAAAEEEPTPGAAAEEEPTPSSRFARPEVAAKGRPGKEQTRRQKRRAERKRGLEAAFKGGAPKRTTKKRSKKVKSKMLKGKSKKHLKKAKKDKKTGKKVRFHSASEKSKKNTRKRR